MTTPLIFKTPNPSLTTYGNAYQTSTLAVDLTAEILTTSNTTIDYNQLPSRPWLSAGTDATANVYKNAGYIGIGSTPTYPLDVQSSNAGISIRATGQILATNFVGTSDARTKSNILPIVPENALKIINSLPVVSFDFIDGPKSQVGFIAQTVEPIVPGAIIQIEEFLPSVFQFMNIEPVGSSGLVTLEAIDATPGDEIRIVGQNKVPIVLSVVNGSGDIDPGKTVLQSPSGVELPAGSYFVYGKKARDFRIINKDILYSYSVGAIQELSRRIEALEALSNSNSKHSPPVTL